MAGKLIDADVVLAELRGISASAAGDLRRVQAEAWHEAAEFKQTCLALMDEVERTGIAIIITKRGKPGEARARSRATTAGAWLSGGGSRDRRRGLLAARVDGQST